MNPGDYVSQVIEELKRFSDKWNKALHGDRWKNFRMIEQITGSSIEEQFKLFLAKDFSQIFVNPDEIDDSLFDLAMWAILWLAYRRMKQDMQTGGRINESSNKHECRCDHKNCPKMKRIRELVNELECSLIALKYVTVNEDLRG